MELRKFLITVFMAALAAQPVCGRTLVPACVKNNWKVITAAAVVGGAALAGGYWLWKYRQSSAVNGSMEGAGKNKFEENLIKEPEQQQKKEPELTGVLLHFSRLMSDPDNKGLINLVNNDLAKDKDWSGYDDGPQSNFLKIVEKFGIEKTRPLLVKLKVNPNTSSGSEIINKGSTHEMIGCFSMLGWAIEKRNLPLMDFLITRESLKLFWLGGSNRSWLLQGVKCRSKGSVVGDAIVSCHDHVLKRALESPKIFDFARVDQQDDRGCWMDNEVFLVCGPNYYRHGVCWPQQMIRQVFCSMVCMQDGQLIISRKGYKAMGGDVMSKEAEFYPDKALEYTQKVKDYVDIVSAYEKSRENDALRNIMLWTFRNASDDAVEIIFRRANGLGDTLMLELLNSKDPKKYNFKNALLYAMSANEAASIRGLLDKLQMLRVDYVWITGTLDDNEKALKRLETRGLDKGRKHYLSPLKKAYQRAKEERFISVGKAFTNYFKKENCRDAVLSGFDASTDWAVDFIRQAVLPFCELQPTLAMKDGLWPVKSKYGGWNSRSLSNQSEKFRFSAK